MTTSLQEKNIPLILKHLQESPFKDEFLEDEILFSNSYYDANLKLNISASGLPLHAALFKKPPTSAFTPGKYIPGGYTRSGKWKAGRSVPAKTDKRAGK